MSTESTVAAHSWVSRPTRVTFEYVDGTISVEDMDAIEAKSRNDRQWVDERLGGSALRSITIEFLDRTDS